MLTELNHFLLVSKNLERTKDFYCRVLGLTVAKERPVFVRAGVSRCAEKAASRRLGRGVQSPGLVS